MLKSFLYLHLKIWLEFLFSQSDKRGIIRSGLSALLIDRESRSAKTVGRYSLDASPRERFSQNLVRARWCAGASSVGSVGGRGISKYRRRGNAKM